MENVFLAKDEKYIAVSSVNAFGAFGTERVSLLENTAEVVLDQNIERVDFSANIAAFSYQQQGNQLKVFFNNELTATLAVPEGNMQLVFADGSIVLSISTNGMFLGGVAVSTSAGSLLPTTIDTSISSTAVVTPLPTFTLKQSSPNSLDSLNDNSETISLLGLDGVEVENFYL